MPSPASSPSSSSPPTPPPSPSPSRESDPAVRRVADLQLRSRTGPVPGRVFWPAPPPGQPRPALLVFLPAGDAASGGLDRSEPLCRALCAQAGIVVLSVSYRPALPSLADAAVEDAVTATRWSADHAAELGADARRLVVGGEGPGAALAAAVARHARDEGWPPIARQVLIRPQLDARLTGEDASVTGVAPATIVTVGGDPGREDARRYAARLRQAGVPVDQRHLDAVSRVVDDLAPALRRSLEEADHD